MSSRDSRAGNPPVPGMDEHGDDRMPASTATADHRAAVLRAANRVCRWAGWPVCCRRSPARSLRSVGGGILRITQFADKVLLHEVPVGRRPHATQAVVARQSAEVVRECLLGLTDVPACLVAIADAPTLGDLATLVVVARPPPAASISPMSRASSVDSRKKYELTIPKRRSMAHMAAAVAGSVSTSCASRRWRRRRGCHRGGCASTCRRG